MLQCARTYQQHGAGTAAPNIQRHNYEPGHNDVEQYGGEITHIEQAIDERHGAHRPITAQRRRIEQEPAVNRK